MGKRLRTTHNKKTGAYTVERKVEIAMRIHKWEVVQSGFKTKFEANEFRRGYGK